MATTTNFGWETPDDTDLVKDGALAMRTLGNSIDTSFVDLKGGTTGQILSKASNTDLDYTWINNDQGDITGVTAGTGLTGGGTTGAVTLTNDMATTITAAGDIVVGTGSGTYDNLPIGTTGQILTADTTVSPYKVKWATPATSSSGLTLISATTFSAVTSHSVNNCFSSTYRYYRILCDFTENLSGNTTLNFRLRASSTDTTTNYTNVMGTMYNTNFDVITGGSTEVLLGDLAGGMILGALQMDIFNPNGTAPTGYQYAYTGFKNTSLESHIGSGVQTASTSFDGFTIYINATNMTGTIKVYGYEN